ncbi:hypothetical protein [Marinobacter mobilis]|uniref:Gluconate 2-dehydrogenase subunit 3 n=1 Tax=Marinobacter mobilis TaxID=488533 RepID=A0A1H2Q515_9GAMM|nr:hypothetical protein [Marinobacter mobilis]SDW02185.1 hypothetical protein SAMN04487960_101118 [Marinobacter mobilis]
MHNDLSTPETVPDPGRRSFLKTGLGGALFLGSVSLTAGISGCATTPAGLQAAAPDGSGDYTFRFLSTDDIVMFEALLPAILGPTLTEAPEQRRHDIRATIETIDAGIFQFGAPNQKELRKLFDLLNFGLTRATLAGVWSSWKNVSTADATAFLDRWKNSSIGLFNQGYIALTKISNVSYYGQPEQWARSGYPGPPEWAASALPQFQTPS